MPSCSQDQDVSVPVPKTLPLGQDQDQVDQDQDQDEVISSVVDTYNQQVEQHSLQPPTPTMDLSEIMEPVVEFEGDKEEEEQDTSVLSTIETLQVIKQESPAYHCVFCKTGQVDETQMGKLYFRNGVVTHYFCMLFSAALCQKGEDSAGILGFLVEDIMREARRSFRLKCVYCNKTGASVGCCQKRCKAAYHYTCGLEHGVNFQFFGLFETFCFEHRNFQKLPKKKMSWTCTICLCEVTKKDFPNSATLAVCCENVFHRSCLQRMALSAGYFFKCPTCNDTKKFIKEMRAFGIYVPEQDASWEKDDAFQDLYVQYSNCDAAECQCPQGRNFSSDKGNWSLARCRLCGGSGTHKRCSRLKTIESWACNGCVEVEKSRPPSKPSVVPVAGPSSACRQSRPNYQNGAKPSTSSDSDSEEEIDMSKLIFRSRTAQYFPHTRVQLAAAQQAGQTSLRDWRNLSLSVEIWDLMSYVFMDSGRTKPTESKPKHPQKSTKNEVSNIKNVKKKHQRTAATGNNRSKKSKKRTSNSDSGTAFKQNPILLEDSSMDNVLALALIPATAYVDSVEPDVEADPTTKALVQNNAKKFKRNSKEVTVTGNNTEPEAETELVSPKRKPVKSRFLNNEFLTY